MKIFITGGSGFIGRNLAEQLGSVHRIFSPGSKELNLLNEADVLDYLRENRFDVILHAATWNATKTSAKDTSHVLENNLRMFFNLARGSGYFGKMIWYGSGAEFDRHHWIPNMSEDYFDSFVPEDQYGFSKYLMNKFTENSTNLINLRLFGVFGKYEDWRIRFISQSCCRVLKDVPITINQDVKFDYTYIDDVVKLTQWFIMNEPADRSYNLCSGQVQSLTTIAEKVMRIAGKQQEIRYVNEGMGMEYSGNNNKLLGEVKDFVFTDMDRSIVDLYHWYMDHPTVYQDVT
jgi:UDP-glucose 4-epimerase